MVSMLRSLWSECTIWNVPGLFKHVLPNDGLKMVNIYPAWLTMELITEIKLIHSLW